MILLLAYITAALIFAFSMLVLTIQSDQFKDQLLTEKLTGCIAVFLFSFIAYPIQILIELEIDEESLYLRNIENEKYELYKSMLDEL